MPSSPSHPNPPTFADFAYAYSMVSSRGFVIDAYHIIGMVPFCDLFNHSSSKSSTSLLSDTAVCAKCGTFGGCEHEPGDAVTPGSPEMENDVVEMRVERPIHPGQEVFSCYEDNASNGKLLVEWGFVEETPSVDGITWSPRHILDYFPGLVRTYVELLSSETLQALGETCSQRIAPPSGTQQGLLNIYPDGRASINLIIGLAIRVISQADPINLETEPGIVRIVKVEPGKEWESGKLTKNNHEAAAEIVKIVQELESDNVSSESAMVTKNTLLELLRDQLRDLDSSGASLAERQQELAELEPQYYYLRMALTLLIQERTILENALRLRAI